MAYQISEKNQILLALFAIVVLCAGKLFKDYLYRGGYIEGLTVVPVSNTVPRRQASETTSANLSLNLTLGAPLATGQTITVSWVAGQDVTMPQDSAVTVTGITSNSKPITTSGANKILTLTNNGASSLNSGSKINITFTGVSITGGNANTNVVFTTKTTTEPTPVTTTINILGSIADSLSESSSAEEIRAALASIRTRLAAHPTDAELLKIQSALVNVLAYTYGTIKEAGKVFDSHALYEAQQTAINFIAKEKARAAANANTLKQDNTNKRRMAQVNTYYTRNYEANTEVMKNIIYVSVALIVLAILRNKELIPASISTLGVIFVLTMGGIVIGRQVFDIIRRNDHDFDKYDWTFNEDQMNNKFVQQNPDSSSLMDLGMGGAPCYGPGCCDTGTRWDAARGLCASLGGALSSQGSSAVWTNPISPAITGNLTITMNITQALVIGDTVTITLPADVFTPEISGASIQGASFRTVSNVNAVMLKNPILITATAGVTAPATVSINITGISVSPSADKSSIYNVKVATSKEPTKIDLRISGLPRE
jgi:Tfp pilus assembly major pilin PilA